MQQQNSGIGCQLGSWALAAGAGLLLFVLLLVMGDWGLIAAIFMAGLVFAVLGLAFSWLFCRDLPAARGAGNVHVGDTSHTNAPAPKAAAPSAASPNAPPPVVDPAPTASEETSPAKAAAVASTAAAPAAKAAPAPKPAAPAPAPKPAAAAPAPEPAPAAPAIDDAAASTPDYDGDGVKEGADEGTKPATLTAARDGGPDNLKEIKGVGPKLEKLLHSMGFYHFDQIANWTADEEAWVNANLEGFKGRVSRDEWVKQAKILAAGGDTEFSNRVDKGDVY